MALAEDTERELRRVATELYRLPLDEFVQARNERARSLKQQRRPQLAARVRKLRKPTVAVWALDQLAREEQPKLRALVQTGQQLRRAEDAPAWRALADRYSALVRELVDAAADILERSGHGSGQERLRQIGTALRAGVIGSDCQALLDGRLSDLPAGADQEQAWAVPLARNGSTPRTSERADSAAARRRARLAEQLQEAELEREQAQRELRSAQRDLDDARAAHARAERAAERAAKRVQQARERIDKLA